MLMMQILRIIILLLKWIYLWNQEIFYIEETRLKLELIAQLVEKLQGFSLLLVLKNIHKYSYVRRIKERYMTR